MKRNILPKWIFYPVAVLFIGLALSGIWLTWQAQKENYYLGVSVNQILRIVTRARNLSLSKDADPQKAQNRLIQALVEEDGMESLMVTDSDALSPRLALANPWGQTLNVMLSPANKELRLVLSVSSHHCRRILGFYTHDTAFLGIKRVDVIPDSSFDLWRLVYDGRKKDAGNMDEERVRINCGHGVSGAISLIFRLP